jgi:transposase
VIVPQQVAALGISEADWVQTPGAVRAVVLLLLQKVKTLEEKINEYSGNSSRPPSTDSGQARQNRRKRKRSGRRRPGGQPGHPRHERTLLPLDQVNRVVPVHPAHCECCHRQFDRHDKATGEPERHQVTEVPPVKPETTEYQLHGRECSDCGHVTKAKLPDGVPKGSFGPRVQALATVSTGVFHLSRRTAQGLMRDFFGVQMCLGSVVNAEQTVSDALATPVAEARAHVAQQGIAHIDETGFWQRAKRAFLWVLSTPLVVIYMVHSRRAREAAQQILAAFKGVLVSDRYIVYADRPNRKRQVCWAHLMRAFQKMVDRGGKSAKVGRGLLEQAALMFQWWHRVRDGTLKRSTLRQYISFHRVQVEALLAKGARCRHGTTARTCREILKVSDAMWTFARVEGVEPTNNEAERALRRAVIWRKTSFGSWSEQGSRFVERMLTVAGTLKKQQRNLVDYLVQVCTAQLHAQQSPSLLPAIQDHQAHAA